MYYTTVSSPYRTTVGSCGLPDVAGVLTAGLRAVDSFVRPIANTGVLAPAPIGVGIVTLRTTGRRTGRRRSHPVLSFRFGSRTLVGTVRRRSDWMANLTDDGEPEITTRGGPTEVAARVLGLGPLGRVAVLEPALAEG